MAKNTLDESLRKIIDDIKHQRFAQVYILHGDEPYYLDIISDMLEACVVPGKEDREFNIDVFYGPDADIPYVIATAQQFPSMCSRRLVMLKEAQGMQVARTQLEKFAPYISKPNPSTVFVIVFKANDPLRATSELMKAAKKAGAVIFESKMPADYQLFAIVRDYATQHRIDIEDKAINLLAETIGTPLSKLFGELNKLASIKGKQRITIQDVEKHVGVSKEYANYELVDAIASRDYPKAMRIVKYYESNPRTSQKNNPVMMVAGTLYNFFSNLVIAHYMQDKSDEALYRQFNFKARIQVSKMRDALRNYSAMNAVNAIHYIREYDTKSKGIESSQDPAALLDDLIFKIFT